MRICLFGYTIGVKGSGAGQYARDLGKWLQREGHEVTLVTGRWKGRSADPEGLRYRFLLSYDSPVGRKVQIDFTLRSLFYFRKHRRDFDLIHSMASYPRFVRVASWVRKAARLPTVHTLLAPCDSRPFFNSIDGLICVSEGIRKRMDSRRAVYIPPFIDLKAFDARSDMGPGTGKTVSIGTMGAPFLRKGVRYLVEAIPLVLEQCPEARFSLAIDLPAIKHLEEIRREREQIDRVIREHRLENRVDILGHVDVPRFLKSLDIFAYAVQTTVGMIDIPPTLLEGLAAGCAIVTSRMGGIEELVKDGHNGLLVAEGDHARPQAYAEKIVALLKTPSLLRTIRERSPASVEKFEIGRVGGQIARFYQKTLGLRVSGE
jgi:glycosyltransferase involved in cell wall biosynthesis